MTEYTIHVPAPEMKAVRKRKTGKLVTRSPFLNSNDRDHFRVTTPIKNYWKKAAADAARDAGLPKGLAHVRIDGTVIKPTASRYDALNFYPTFKASVDGLIDYGLCADDDNAHVSGPFITAGGKGPAAITITITEVSE